MPTIVPAGENRMSRLSGAKPTVPSIQFATPLRSSTRIQPKVFSTASVRKAKTIMIWICVL
ncbi:hypothetical protein D3C72_2288310 [compost metagenome]